MKTFLLLSFLSLSLLSVQGEPTGEMHEFTNKKGQSIRASIQSYDANRKVVQLKRENGKTAKIPLSALSEADQKYIESWVFSDGFLNDSKFKISCSKKLGKKSKEKLYGLVYRGSDSSEEQIGIIKLKDSYYELKFENRNAFPLEKIEVEYRIFCKKKGTEPWEKEISAFTDVKKGTLTIDTLPSHSKKILKTEPVTEGKQEIDAELHSMSSGGAFEATAQVLEGIWIQIHFTTKDGKTVTRILCDPDNLKKDHAWD